MNLTEKERRDLASPIEASDEIDASIVALVPETPLIDERWVIVLDPHTIETDGVPIRLTVADLVGDDDDQDEEAE